MRLPEKLNSYKTRSVVAAVLAICATAAVAQQETTKVVPRIEIVLPTPVPGLGVPQDRVPANVQVLSERDLGSERAASTPELLGRQVPSVNVNEIQGNPYQADVNYRGYAASPLLGTPQGLSVYQDGVRINDPFGDVVSWDLIPQVAIDSVTLIPGSNPLFGLNTLGGALSLRTKSGETHPGAEAELSGGSFGRRVEQFQVGRRFGEDTHGYIAGTRFQEDGWRDFSPSEVNQLFAKFGHRGRRAEIDIGLTVADTDLVGNGLAPQSFLERRREAVFTRPDNTRHRMNMLTASGSYFLPDESRITGTLYQRRVKARTLNGDVNDDFKGGPNDTAAGETGSNIGTAASNRTTTDQSVYGGALQWSAIVANHQFALGGTFDRSKSDFAQSTQLGVFDNTRAVIETDPQTIENSLTGRTGSTSLFVTDTWSLRSNLHLTASARYNRTHVTLQDTGPSAPALDGIHTFTKLNPAAGFSYQASDALTFYGGFTQGNRAPTPIELGCADPARPCTLPNALAADPPLNQVIARTWELGARGRIAGDVRWNAGLFDATNTDDILFVGTTTSAGFFKNFGKTRRRGVELGLSGARSRLEWKLAYSYVRATYESNACIVSENNSSRGTSPACSPEDPANPGTFVGDDLIAIRPGQRIPGIPAHSAKLLLNFNATEQWRVGADIVAFSEQYVRGNENNQHQAGTFTDLNAQARTFLGSGKVPGYTVVNLHTRYRIECRWELFGNINNLFNRNYYTAGALAENPFTAAGTFQTNSDAWTHETFYAPAAPRSAWVGIRYRLGTESAER